jgi:hypothetical protein
MQPWPPTTRPAILHPSLVRPQHLLHVSQGLPTRHRSELPTKCEVANELHQHPARDEDHRPTDQAGPTRGMLACRPRLVTLVAAAA